MAIPTADELANAEAVAAKLGKTIKSDIKADRLKLTMWTKSNQGILLEQTGSSETAR